jgi:selenocysteine lyase/cysteine desulfurase
MGLGDSGAIRAGLAPYTTADEVDRLLDATMAFVEGGMARVGSGRRGAA